MKRKPFTCTGCLKAIAPSDTPSRLGFDHRELAAMYRITRSYAGMIVRRQRWTHVGVDKETVNV